MSGYYGDEALTHSIMKEGVIYTSDRGTVDEQGRLRLKGRDGDIINVGGYKVAPDEVEDAALSLPIYQGLHLHSCQSSGFRHHSETISCARWGSSIQQTRDSLSTSRQARTL